MTLILRQMKGKHGIRLNGGYYPNIIEIYLTDIVAPANRGSAPSIMAATISV